MIIPPLDDLTEQAEYKQHPYGKVWQRFEQEPFAELVSNIDRRGLDKEIILYQDMILEGWHRYLACLATKIKPKFTEFNGTDLEAAELVHASGIRRHSSADQRYASFSLLCDACPEFRAKYEELEAKGEQQQKEGKPLDTDAQRVDVVKAKADAAGVSKTTAKKVEKVKKENPGAVEEIAAGKTTANKELKNLKKKGKAKGKPKKESGPSAANHTRHNYKHDRHTKVMVAQQTPHSPESFLVTLKSVLPPAGSTWHDLFIVLDRSLADSLHQRLGEALAGDSKAKSAGDGRAKTQPNKRPKP